jgi:hypothetical protein
MNDNAVRIAISLQTLATLLERGDLHAVDFRCLDGHAKKTVWRLLLAHLKNHLNEPSEQIRYV